MLLLLSLLKCITHSPLDFLGRRHPQQSDPPQADEVCFSADHNEMSSLVKGISN